MWEVLKLAVAGAVRPPRALPPVLFYNELDGLPRDAWLGFQAALLATDRRVNLTERWHNSETVLHTGWCRNHIARDPCYRLDAWLEFQAEVLAV